ncbi:MAG: shikimate kinase [Thermoanaerobaculia bacterium]|nr:shikimate kinase [Thermoanaerobaculia bacterium]
MTTGPGRVFLVGFVGAGKSTAGRALAGRLDVPFLDLDEAFEALAGLTIRRAFEERGEAWFREREAELLRGCEAFPDVVVALGGGTFTFPENRAVVRRTGRSLFLDVPFEAIAARLGVKAIDRPLFRSLEEARALYEERRASYRLSDTILALEGDEGVDAVVDRIVEALESRGVG